MDDKQRTKVLGAILAGVVAVFGLRSSAASFLMKPVNDLQKKIDSANKKNESLRKQNFDLNTARAKIEAWKGASLPPDPDIAQRLYREWVAELTRHCGFAGSTFDVAPGGRSAQKGYTAIGIDVKNAEASLEELSRFLYLFEQTDLMQRVVSLRMDSTGAKGNPDLKFSMTIEGMILEKVDPRSELFSRSQVAAPVTATATELAVTTKEGFPEEFPFVVRLDRENQQEYVLVESATETGWKIKRGHFNSKSFAHAANTVIEAFPVNYDRKDTSIDSYSDFVKTSMFVIPSPPKSFNPRLAGVSDQNGRPGQPIAFSARAENFDPEKGEPVFALKDAVEGMAIDPKTGAFTWTPAATVASGKYTATVVLTQANNPEVNLESKLTVTLKSLNEAPKLTVPESGIVILERPFTATATATDEGGTDGLKFSLGSGSPEGLKIDEKTGVIEWTPPRTFTPGKYDVEIKVTDSGEDPKSDSKKIALDVQDDNASLTVLTSLVGKDGVLYAWFRNKGKDTTDKLKTGDTLTVAEITVEIASMTNRFVTLKDAEGIWKLELGQNVRERKLIEPAPKPAAAEPATTTPEANSTPAPTAEAPTSETPTSEPPAPDKEPVVPSETPATQTEPAPAPTETPATTEQPQ